MRARWIIGLAALALIPSPAPAQGGPPATAFSTFQSLCIANEGREGPTAAQADAQGWMAVPDSMVPMPPTSVFTLNSKAVRLRSSAQSFDMLLVGQGSILAHGTQIPADICAIGVKPADPAAISALQAWAAVPERGAPGGMSFYPFLDIAGRHVPASMGDASMIDAAEGGRLRLVGSKLMENNGMLLLIYMAARGKPV